MTKISKDVMICAFFDEIILYINRITPLGHFVIKKCRDLKKKNENYLLEGKKKL